MVAVGETTFDPVGTTRFEPTPLSMLKEAAFCTVQFSVVLPPEATLGGVAVKMLITGSGGKTVTATVPVDEVPSDDVTVAV